MGWYSFVLLLLVTLLHGNLSSTSLDDPAKNINLNESSNDPPSQEHGQQMDKKRKRILGGTEYVPPGNSGIPDWEHWTASLRIEKWEGVPLRHTGFTFCGGVLITKQHILTALHCIMVKQPEYYGEILNYDDVEIFFDPENVKLWKGMRFRPIKYYYTNMNTRDRKAERLNNKTAIKDDIVMMKLNTIAPAPLKPILRSRDPAIFTLTKGDLGDETNNFWFAGWGIYRLPRQPAQILRYTDELTKMRRSMSRKLCPDHPDYQNTNICFYSTTSHAVCEGDSGSPGVVGIYDPPTSTINPVWHLQSISSRGRNCSNLPSTEDDSYSIHMDVFEYEKDINDWLALP